MFNPTGLPIRSDSEGDGNFLSARGTRLHNGIDFESIPGKLVIAPCDMRINRIAKPKSGCYLSGIKFTAEFFTGKMFYLKPYLMLIGTDIKKGSPIGIAQDMTKEYGPKMTSHIHLQIKVESNEGYVYVNPMMFIKGDY